jgi:hypothetical protein
MRMAQAMAQALYLFITLEREFRAVGVRECVRSAWSQLIMRPNVSPVHSTTTKISTRKSQARLISEK